jgi:hypothetical protein
MTETKTTKTKKTSIYDALIAFQSENIIIPRNGTGKADGGKIYKYATLDDVINITRPFLQKHGLVFTQMVCRGEQGSELRTSIISTNATGTPNQIDSVIPLGSPNNAQDMGSRITYMRRYALVPILGLSIEEDTDSVPPEVTVNEPKQPVANIIPLQEKVNEIENKVQKSVPHQKAYDTVLSCQNDEALEMVKDRIVKSEKLNDAEKSDLFELIKTKETELSGTIHTS